MRKSTTRGVICLDGPENVVYRLCGIAYTVWEDESFEYRFRPDYRVIDLVGPPEFQGIPGVDLSLRREEYVRRNRVPVFVSERTPAANREDLWKHLDDVGLDHLNQLEWLIRTETRYVGDALYVARYDEDGIAKRTLDIDEAIRDAANVENALRAIVGALAGGADIVVEGQHLEDAARKPLFATTLPLLTKGHAYRESRRSSAGALKQGRKRKPVDGIRLADAIERYEAHQLSARDAACELGIGEATFYRRLKEQREASQ